MRKLGFLFVLFFVIGFAGSTFAQYGSADQSSAQDDEQVQEDAAPQDEESTPQEDPAAQDDTGAAQEGDSGSLMQESSGVSAVSAPASDGSDGKFAVESTTFQDDQTMPASMVFNGFGCFGGNVSPQLSWRNAPEGTKSFAITQYDPDAPTGSGWWHWGVYNIPLDVTSIDEGASRTGKNAMPMGVSETLTDFGTIGYGGSCPPVGDQPHHYHTTVYALDTDKMDLDPFTTTTTMLAFMLHGHTLGKATITALNSR